MVIQTLNLPESRTTPSGEVHLREARASDLPRIVELLADDSIVRGRNDTPSQLTGSVRTAFERISSDSSNSVVVAVMDELVVGILQLTLIPGLSRNGMTRLLIEAVRVAGTRQSCGIGTIMLRWCIDDAARSVGAGLVQLTSDSVRHDTHRFYTRLGFEASHTGFKLRLASA